MSTQQNFIGRIARIFFCGAALLLGVAAEAEYLPDAAAHLGTVVINQDDQFTTNPLVTLTIHAISTGSGLSQMQFSSDDQNWSAPQTYATSAPWQFSVTETDYPPLMNTVLKTIYVRVKYGNGTWSKAFSDGIIFARSALDVPKIDEVWVMQKRPSNYSSTQPLGSQRNPYIVPSGSNEVAFDSLMNTLAKSYSQYTSSPYPNQTNIPPMNGVSVLSLHLGTGTFETHGDGGGFGNALSWSPTAGSRIKGAGKNLTLLKLVGGNLNALAHVIGNWAGPGMGVYNNLEISDLTIDANMHEGGDTTSTWERTGVVLAGNNVQLRRLRVQGFGSRVPGLEPAGLAGYNAGIGNLYNFHIEDCEIVQPQSINSYYPLMIGYEGGGKDAQSNPLYMNNVVIRNNYVNGLMYDQNVALNPYTNSFNERGTHGVCLGGCKNSIVEDNLVIHVISGYYNDTFDLNDVLVRNNHFRDVIAGLNFGTGAADRLDFEGNLVELDPHYYTTPYPGGTGPSDYGWRLGAILNEQLRIPLNRAIIRSNVFQFTDKASPTSPLTGSFAIASLSGTADFEYNTTFGFSHSPIRWYQAQGFPIGYLDRQADILDPSKPAPIVTLNNHYDDGTIIETYPYVLDKTLPQSVVIPNQLVSFPAPPIKGTMPRLVTGLPVTNVIDQNGIFKWVPTSNDIGRFVVSFYDSVQRTNDPRRMLITVQSGLTNFSFFSGIEAYWQFKEDSGYSFLDYSGSGNSILFAPTVLNYITRGVPGHRVGQKAIHFENTNPNKAASLVIQNNNANLFNGYPVAFHPRLQRSTVLTKPFTVSYWFKADHKPVNNEVIFNFGSLVVSGVGPGPSGATNLAEVFCSFPYSPDLTFYQALHPQTITVTIGEWHHEVFVYDGVSTRLYLDGIKQAEIPFGQIEDFSLDDAVYLGGGSGGDNYLGSFSELTIWNHPLTDADVTNLFTLQQQSAISSLNPPANFKVGQ